MNYFSSYGVLPASTPALLRRKEIDLRHNNVPFITCEGKCSEARKTFTTHTICREIFDKELDGFRQDYKCTICGTERLFGLCESRMTLTGERN